MDAILRNDFVADAWDVYLRERGPGGSSYLRYRPGKAVEDVLEQLVEAVEATLGDDAGIERELREAVAVVKDLQAQRAGATGFVFGLAPGWERVTINEHAVIDEDRRPTMRLPEDVLRALVAAGSEVLPPDRALANHLEDAIKVRDRVLDELLRPSEGLLDPPEPPKPPSRLSSIRRDDPPERTG